MGSSDSHEDRNIPAASAGLPSTPPTLDATQITLLRMAIRTRSRVPHQCTKALEQASKAKIKTTESIFFEHGGLVACAAYILTKYESRRAEGKNKVGRVRLLDLLEKLPVKARQSAALQLEAAMEPDKDKITRVVEKAFNSNGYAQYLHRRSTTPSEEAQKDASLRKPNECRNTVTPSSTRLISSEPAHQASDHSVSHSRHDDIPQSPWQDAPHLYNHIPLLSSSSANNDKRKFTIASIAACNDVFPDHLVEAITRSSEQGHTSANVTIQFAHGNDWKALLSIQVMLNKIEDIAF